MFVWGGRGINENPIFFAVFNLNELFGSSFAAYCSSFLFSSVEVSTRLKNTQFYFSSIICSSNLFFFAFTFCEKKSNWLFVRVSLVASPRVEFELWFDFRVIQESTKTFRSIWKKGKEKEIKKAFRSLMEKINLNKE